MDQIYTLDEVARLLRVNKETVRRILRAGELQGFLTRKHGSWRVTQTALNEYIKRSEFSPEAE